MNSILCGTEHYVPNRELNTTAKHMLNSNTWVIPLMIRPCLSALLELSQSALCLAKLSSKWDKTSPMYWRKGKDVTPTCSCQKWMVCWPGGGNTLSAKLGWSCIDQKASTPPNNKTRYSFLIPNNWITHILIPAFVSIIILQSFLESLYCWNPYARRKCRQGICIILPHFPTTWLSAGVALNVNALKNNSRKGQDLVCKSQCSVKVSDNSRKLRG